MPNGIEFNADGELEIKDPWLREEIAKAVKERREIKLWSRGFSRLDSGAVLLALRSILGREIPGIAPDIQTNIPCNSTNPMCPCRVVRADGMAAPGAGAGQQGKVGEDSTAARGRTRRRKSGRP